MKMHMRNNRKGLLVISMLMGALSWAPIQAEEPEVAASGEPAEAVESEDAGRIVGRVVYTGRVARAWKAPEEAWTPPEGSVDAEPDPSAAPSPPAIQITESGGIRETAVWLENEKARKAVRRLEFDPLEIDQKGSVFYPGMVVMPRGGTLKLKNSDGINHNVHLLSHRQEKNFLLRSGDEREVRLNHEDKIRVTCDLHAWMRSSLVIVESPYYTVTDKEGRFEIGEVPPGTYQVKVAHHRFEGDPEALEVVIKAGETSEVEIQTALSRWDH